MVSAPAANTAQRAALASVAERAGVSRQTVSNLLHSPHVVQVETRRRVRDAIRELDYPSEPRRRHMRTSKSQAIAVRIQPSEDGINAVVLDRLMHVLCSTAEARGYHLVVFTAPDDGAEIVMYEHLLSTLAIDGFVVVVRAAAGHSSGRGSAKVECRRIEHQDPAGDAAGVAAMSNVHHGQDCGSRVSCAALYGDTGSTTVRLKVCAGPGVPTALVGRAG